MPELIGHLKPEDVGNMVLNYLENPDTLAKMKANLVQVRGEAGAAEKIAKIVNRQLFRND